MKALAVALMASMFPLAVPAETVLVDDAGNRLVLEQPARRIVTLAPHLAEMVYELGVGDRLVGTVEWSDWPPAARNVPRVGDGFRMDAERVIALQPDLVIAWGGGTPQGTVERLKALEQSVAVLTPSSLESIPRHVEWLGKATGTGSKAESIAERFRARLQGLRTLYGTQPEVRVFYQINDPLLFTIGGEHFITEAIEVCGGTNIFGELPPGAHAISREDVLARDPEVIVIGSHDETLYDSANWKAWQDLTAVAADNVLTVDAALLARAAPRILDGVEQLCRKLEHARERLQAVDRIE